MERHRASRKFEADIARDLNGKRIFLSGAGFEKADVRVGSVYSLQDGAPSFGDALTFRVEAKTTNRDCYSFRTTDWQDLIRVADKSRENPVFAIRFLRTGYALAITRTAFAQEIGSLIEEPESKINRSITLHDGVCYRLSVPRERIGQPPRKPDLLTALPYKTFIQGVQGHALFA